MEIVEEAYGSERNIRSTALKHSVQTQQIWNWKKRSTEGITEGMDLAARTHVLTLKLMQSGWPCKNKDLYEPLRLYYNNLHSMDQVVTIGMLCFELKRAMEIDVPMEVLPKRVYQNLSSHKVVQ